MSNADTVRHNSITSFLLVIHHGEALRFNSDQIFWCCVLVENSFDMLLGDNLNILSRNYISRFASNKNKLGIT